MADNTNQRPPMGQPGAMAPETSVGRQGSLGVELGMPLPDGQRPQVEREPDKGRTAEFDPGTGKVNVENANPDPKLEDGDQGGQDGDQQQEQQEQPPGDAAALPEFDAAKPEVVEAYTKAYVKEDGTLNEDALSNSWMKNMQVDPKTGDISGSLSEGDYKFLESKGISRGMVKQVEALRIGQLKQDREAVFTKAGGADKYNAALAWARSGGYSDQAKAKFNADLNAGGATRDDAVDLLMQRFTKANPPPRRRTPEVTSANAGNPAGGRQAQASGYASYADYQADLRASRAGKEGAPSLEDVRAKLRNSPWYNKR